MGKNENFLVRIELVAVFAFVDDVGLVVAMSLDADSFGMIGFADDDDLLTRFVVLARDILRARHHGTGAVNQFDAEFFGFGIRFRRFAVRANQNLLGSSGRRHSTVLNRRQAAFFKP